MSPESLAAVAREHEKVVGMFSSHFAGRFGPSRAPDKREVDKVYVALSNGYGPQSRINTSNQIQTPGARATHADNNLSHLMFELANVDGVSQATYFSRRNGARLHFGMTFDAFRAAVVPSSMPAATRTTFLPKVMADYLWRMNSLAPDDFKPVLRLYAAVSEWTVLNAVHAAYDTLTRRTPPTWQPNPCVTGDANLCVANMRVVASRRAEVAGAVEILIRQSNLDVAGELTARINEFAKANINNISDMVKLKETAGSTHQSLQTTLRLEERVRRERDRLRTALWVWVAALIGLVVLAVWSVLSMRLPVLVVACAAVLAALAMTAVWGV